MDRPPDLPRFRTLDLMTREVLKQIRGKATGRKSGNETEHFYTCAVCAQGVDRRSLYQVVYQDDVEHSPLTEAELSELAP